MTSTTDTAPSDPASSACASGHGVPTVAVPAGPSATGTPPIGPGSPHGAPAHGAPPDSAPADGDRPDGDTPDTDTPDSGPAARRRSRPAVDVDTPEAAVPHGGASPAHRVRRRRRRSVLRGDDGMSTVEYAIGTVAAAAFAAILYAVVSGDSIVGALTGIVQRALAPTF